MVELQGFTRRYGEFTAVDGISLSIPGGLIYGLLGPNGAGKSTTVKCVTGILRPSAGSIVVEGIDVAQRPIEVKRLVGYVPESPVLFRTLTGRETLTLAGRLHHLEEEALAARAEELLEAFGLAQKADEQVQGYSRGMAQKVAIAAALIHNPRVVVLDEALAGLDASAAAVLKRLLRSLADSGRTVIFCSHVLEVVERLCDKVAIINDGKLVLETEMAELRHGSETLEDTFVRAVGAERSPDKLDWL